MPVGDVRSTVEEQTEPVHRKEVKRFALWECKFTTESAGPPTEPPLLTCPQSLRQPPHCSAAPPQGRRSNLHVHRGGLHT